MFKSNLESEDDSEKIERMYHEYKNLMYKEAYNILKDIGLAEDAVHQSFIKIINNMDKINMKDERRTRSFLVIVCRNTAIDIYKKRLYLNQNSNSLDFEIDEDDDAPIDYIEPSKVIVDKETVNKIVDAIDKLPEIYRDVLLLEKLHGNTKEEIAELLGVNYETVKKRSLRARKILLDVLEEEDLIYGK